MHYIKLLATDSTNTELRRRQSRNPRMSNTSLFATHQKEGRGQRGTNWVSDHHKNLTFSILLNDLHLKASDNFKLNAIISLSIHDFLKKQTDQVDFYIKWPNDILAGRKKICGILIENILMGSHIKSAIIGMGINTNQTDFENLPKATSLSHITGETYPIEELWSQLTETIAKNLRALIDAPLAEVLERYEENLFKKDSNAIFEFPDGTTKNGIIRGVSPLGKLRIQLSEGMREFQLKEVKLIY